MILVLQRLFLQQGDFREQFEPDNVMRRATAIARWQLNTKSKRTYLGIRRCNTSSLSEDYFYETKNVIC